MVVIDCFSKYAHLECYLLTSRPTKAADLFTNIVCKHHGFSKSIISCRDPIFLSKSWKTLLQLDDTKLRMSTTYHPQLDGQFEVLNIYLQQYHRHLFIKNHLQEYLPWAECQRHYPISSCLWQTPSIYTILHPRIY